MNLSPLLELNPRQTVMAIIGRPVYSIQCCDALMIQKHVKTRLEAHKVFGLSVVMLECQVCTRRIEVELSDIIISRDWLVESARLEFDFAPKEPDPEAWAELTAIPPIVKKKKDPDLNIAEKHDENSDESVGSGAKAESDPPQKLSAKRVRWSSKKLGRPPKNPSSGEVAPIPLPPAKEEKVKKNKKIRPDKERVSKQAALRKVMDIRPKDVNEKKQDTEEDIESGDNR